MSKINALSVQELIDAEGGPIYVLNNTENSIGQGGDVFITVNQNGQNRSLQVPHTWLPIEVTKMIPRKYILDSSYFLEALGKELVVAIPAEDALKLLAQPAAVRELSRLKQAEEAVKAATASRGIGRNVSVVNSDADDSGEEQGQGKKTAVKKAGSAVSMADFEDEGSAEAEEEEVSAKFKAWVNTLNQAEEEDAVSKLRTRSSLTEAECKYIIENVQHKRIVNGMKRKLDDVQG